MKEIMKTLVPLLIISLIAALLFCEVYGVVYAINVVSSFALLGAVAKLCQTKLKYKLSILKEVCDFKPPTTLDSVVLAVSRLIALPVIYLLYEQGHYYTLAFLLFVSYLVGLVASARDDQVWKYAQMSTGTGLK